MPDDLTLDVNILLISHNKSNIPCEDKHRRLLGAFDSLVFLALDDGGHIRQLYVNRLGSNSLATKWLTSLATKSRIHVFPFGKIPRPLKVRLDETGFHWADDKYCRFQFESLVFGNHAARAWGRYLPHGVKGNKRLRFRQAK